MAQFKKKKTSTNNKGGKDFEVSLSPKITIAVSDVIWKNRLQKLQRVMPDRRYTTIMCRKCVRVFKTYVTLCSWTSRPPRRALSPCPRVCGCSGLHRSRSQAEKSRNLCHKIRIVGNKCRRYISIKLVFRETLCSVSGSERYVCVW